MSSDTKNGFPELVDKVIERLQIFCDPRDGTEVHIDFRDGTSFSCHTTTNQRTEAKLLRCGGPGEPELIKHLFEHTEA